MGRRGYPPEFRRKVLDLIEAGRKVADVARDPGIRGQSIYTWRRQDRIDRGVEVVLDGLGGLVSEPERDHREVDAGMEQRHGSGVRVTFLPRSVGLVWDGFGGVLGDQVLDGVGAEGAAAAGAKQRIGVVTGPITLASDSYRRPPAVLPGWN